MDALRFSFLNVLLFGGCFVACFLFVRLVFSLVKVIAKKILKSPHYSEKVLRELKAAIQSDNTIECMKIIRDIPGVINYVFDEHGYTPFLMTAVRGNSQLLKFMLSNGADIRAKTANGENSFYLASYNLLKNRSSKDASCLHTLFHAGVDINGANKKGYSSLQMAAIFGHTSLIKWLLSKNANAYVTPDPCLLAEIEGHTSTARMILSKKQKSIML